MTRKASTVHKKTHDRHSVVVGLFFMLSFQGRGGMCPFFAKISVASLVRTTDLVQMCVSRLHTLPFEPRLAQNVGVRMVY